MTNPMLNDKVFSGVRTSDAVMTVNGTVQKAAGLLFLLICSASYTWTVARADGGAAAMPWMLAGLFGAFISVIIMAFKHEWSPVLAPAYAIAEGLFIGAISAWYQGQYQGIVMSAVCLSIATLGVMLVLYRAGWLRATETFVKVIVVATAAVAIVYLVSMCLRVFGHYQIPLIYGNGPMGIGFSLFVVVLAALNFIVDFAVIENGAANGSPLYMEWYAGCGLLITLVWLYLEILRLLAKLQRRD